MSRVKILSPPNEKADTKFQDYHFLIEGPGSPLTLGTRAESEAKALSNVKHQLSQLLGKTPGVIATMLRKGQLKITRKSK